MTELKGPVPPAPVTERAILAPRGFTNFALDFCAPPMPAPAYRDWPPICERQPLFDWQAIGHGYDSSVFWGLHSYPRSSYPGSDTPGNLSPGVRDAYTGKDR